MRHLLMFLSLAMIHAMIHSPAVLAENSSPQKPKSSPKPVTVTGKLEAGLMAIGGETTGTRVTTSNNRVYELEFVQHPELQESIDEFDGKEVTVTGPMRLIRGVERNDRWVIDVLKLQAKDASKASQTSTGAPQDEMKYSATANNKETTVRLVQDKEGLDVEIVSLSGIDTVTITRIAGQWSSPITLQLNLKGLEHLEVTAGDQTQHWGVSAAQPNEFRTWTNENGAEITLPPDSPRYSPVRREHSSIQNDGYAVTLPAGLLESNPESITVRFIDFYR